MKFIRCVGAWIYYCLGDLASKILLIGVNNCLWCNFWYPVYSKLMAMSYDIQADYVGKNWPWSHILIEYEDEDELNEE